MKTYMAILGGVLAVFASSVQAETFSPCQVAYLTGLEFFEQGEYQEASESFFESITLDPEPDAELAEYIPYLYLAVSRYEVGNTQEARDALIQSQVFGVAPETEAGRDLLNRYAAKIMSAPLDQSRLVMSPQSSPVKFDDKSYSITENEAEIIRSQVLRRCALSSKVNLNRLPWYFHYEYGRDLLDAGDSERAIEAFVLGANISEDPGRGKRMYGMWFIDYLPYYQIALAHSKLGEWESAQTAIQTSENYGEFSPKDPDYESFTSLEQLIEQHLQTSDS
jgi:tetratricopeptide (TPR) repeat protein